MSCTYEFIVCFHVSDSYMNQAGEYWQIKQGEYCQVGNVNIEWIQYTIYYNEWH